MHQTLNKQQAFTIVELMLAMTFITLLLLAIAATGIGMGKIYTKGVTIREVNQSGRLLSQEIQKIINSSEPFDIVENSAETNLNTLISINASSEPETSGGRLCANNFFFMWNYGAAIKKGANDVGINKIEGPSGNNQELSVPRFIVVYPNSKSALGACRKKASGSLPKVLFGKEPSVGAGVASSGDFYLGDSHYRTLLSSGSRGLALYDFKISSKVDLVKNPDLPSNLLYDPGSNQRLYNISFVLGTENDGALTNISGSGGQARQCRPPSEDDRSEKGTIYCSISTFEFMARAGNKKLEEDGK